jgi:hypothetical protein
MGPGLRAPGRAGLKAGGVRSSGVGDRGQAAISRGVSRPASTSHIHDISISIGHSGRAQEGCLIDDPVLQGIQGNILTAGDPENTYGQYFVWSVAGLQPLVVARSVGEAIGHEILPEVGEEPQ